MQFLEISYCSYEGRLTSFRTFPVVRNTNRIRTFWRFCIAPAKASWTDLADFPESVRVSCSCGGNPRRQTEGTDISVRNMGVGLSAYSDKGSSTQDAHAAFSG